MTTRTRLPLPGMLLCAAVLLCCTRNAAAPKQSKATKGANSMSFIVLGDMHYDRLEDHDMEWLATKPGDLRQVTQTYVPNTENNWNDLMGVLRRRAESATPPVKAVVQLGDISEGLAGSPGKAVQMARSVMTAVKDADLYAPWILSKGNHDITGPGAREAFEQIYVPFMREESGVDDIANATYSYRLGEAQFVMLDPWDPSVDPADFVTGAFEGSDAKYRFVCIHEPIIPVTERCWHVLRTKPEQREKLLEAIAKSKAIVLCGHLHRYSVARRDTDFGPIVQVMLLSMVGDKRASEPSYSFNSVKDYGPALVDWKPDYEPDTADKRREMLAAEAPFVSYYQMCELAGYGVISIDSEKEEVTLSYYAAFESEPFDVVNLTGLQNGKE